LYHDFDKKYIVESIEQETSILIRTNHEKYPYTPYEFTMNELNYIQLVSKESVDTRCPKSLSVVKRYNDQDEYK